MKRFFLATALLITSVPLFAGEPASLAPSEIVGQAAAADWRAIAGDDLLVMDLAPDAGGKDRRVVIQLMPPPFSQGWIGNIRKLVAARWLDGTSVNRVQDNYVAQWGDADADDKNRAKRLPDGLEAVPQTEYSAPLAQAARYPWLQPKGPAEVGVGRDAYSFAVAFRGGWPFGGDNQSFWPIHCYGMVGVGRAMPPDTGSGAELYAVIGTPPRHLDRNIALVGRVIEGIEHLSSLPRGTGPLGFYEKAEERVPIRAIRLGNEVPGLPAYQYLSTESPSFARYADARANRRDSFFIRPAGGADICNIPVPVRRAP